MARRVNPLRTLKTYKLGERTADEYDALCGKPKKSDPKYCHISPWEYY